MLGEAYAFGVIWSFAFKGLAMVVLRFKDRSTREWEVPLNLKLGSTEIPLGLGIIAALLFSVAGINLITKEVATVSGVAFTVIFFTIFLMSEHINEKRRKAAHVEMEQFRIYTQDHVSNDTVNVRPGNTLCLVRDYNQLTHLVKALEWTDTAKKDLVVLTVHITKGPHSGYEDIREEHLFTKYEELLFTRVVAVAEKAGKHVSLLVVPSSNFYEAAVRTAAQLESTDFVAGHSRVINSREQAERFSAAWDELETKPSQFVMFTVVRADGGTESFSLGASSPDFSTPKFPTRLQPTHMNTPQLDIPGK